MGQQVLKEVHSGIFVMTVDNARSRSTLTAFLLDAEGHLLTARHMLEPNQDIAVRVQVRHAITNWQGFAELQEISRNLDFSIWKISGIVPAEAKPLPLQISKLQLGPEKPVQGIIVGYSKGAGDELVTRDVSITYSSYQPGAPTETVLNMSTTASHLGGVSGGPVLVKFADGYRVAGIVVQQESPLHILRALPMHRILRSSTKLQGISKRQRELLRKINSRVLHQTLIQLSNSGLRPIIHGTPVRRGLFVLPIEAADWGANIVDKVNAEIPKIGDRIRKLLASFDWLVAPSQKLYFSHQSTNARAAIPVALRFLLPPLGNTTISITDLHTLRVICDLTSSVDFEDTIDWNEASQPSHVVALQCVPAMGPVAMDANNRAIDLVLPLSRHSESQMVQDISVAIEDMLLEANVFYNIPILSNLFDSTTARRQFTLLKSEFAHSNGLIPPETRYVSFAALSRNGNRLDVDKYKLLWSKFINEFLLRKFSENQNGIYNESDLMSACLNFHEAHAEKLSLRKVKYHVKNHHLRSGDIGAIFVVTSRVRESLSEYATIKRLIGNGKARPGAFGIINSKELGALLGVQRFIKFRLYRYAA